MKEITEENCRMSFIFDQLAGEDSPLPSNDKLLIMLGRNLVCSMCKDKDFFKQVFILFKRMKGTDEAMEMLEGTVLLLHKTTCFNAEAMLERLINEETL